MFKQNLEYELLKQEKRWQIKKKLLERKLALKEEKDLFKSKFKKKISNSKLLVWFLFINCTLIELFTGWVTLQELKLAETGLISPDLSPLLALISTVVAEVIGFGIYSLKSAKENTAGGIIYETAMEQLRFEEQQEKKAVG